MQDGAILTCNEDVRCVCTPTGAQVFSRPAIHADPEVSMRVQQHPFNHIPRKPVPFRNVSECARDAIKLAHSPIGTDPDHTGIVFKKGVERCKHP